MGQHITDPFFLHQLVWTLVLFMMNNPHIFMLISKFTALNKNQINKDGFIHLYIR